MNKNYQDLSLAELCELLIQRTEKLLSSIENNQDGVALRDLKVEVEEIQSEIRRKKEKV
jgi:hypothetical protein